MGTSDLFVIFSDIIIVMIRRNTFLLFLILVFVGIVFVVTVVFAESGTVLVKPEELSVEKLSACAAQISWEWGAPPHSEVDFVITRGTRPNPGSVSSPLSESSPVGELPTTTSTIDGRYFYIDNQRGRLFGNTFFYYVAAWDDAGAPSLPSNYESVAFGFPSDLPVPSAPQNLSVGWNDDMTAIDLSWELGGGVPSEFGGFEVLQSVDGGPFQLVRIVDEEENVILGRYRWRDNRRTSFHIPITDNTQSYVYKVREFYSEEFCSPRLDGVVFDEAIFSDFSEEKSVFAVPQSVDIDDFRSEVFDNVNIRLLWEYDAGFDGEFIIWRYTDDDIDEDSEIGFSGGDGFSSLEADGFIVPSGSAGDIVTYSYEDTGSRGSGLEENRVYYYTWQAKEDGMESPVIGPISEETGVARSINVRAIPLESSGGGMLVGVSWDNKSLHAVRFEVERSSNGGLDWDPACDGEVLNEPNVTSCTDTGTDHGEEYLYRVKAYDNEGRDSPWSEHGSVDLNVTPVLGWAWANAGQSGGNVLGIGWISLSSSNGIAGAGELYGVFVDNNEVGEYRELSGYGWNGIECKEEDRVEHVTCGYGWLSFEKDDLQNCPEEPCVARIHVPSGELSGWARFIAADPTKSEWDGWVSLRMVDDAKYGVCFGDTHPVLAIEEDGSFTSFGDECLGNGSFDIDGGSLSGWAWGDDVGGWIQFLGGGGDCAFDGVVNITGSPNVPLRPGGEFTFTAQRAGNEHCTDEDIPPLVTWGIEPPSDYEGDYGSIGEYSGVYEAPDSLPSGVRISPTIIATSGDANTSSQVTVEGDAVDNICRVNSVRIVRAPNAPPLLGDVFGFHAVVIRSGDCSSSPSVALVSWSVDGGDSFGSINESTGLYAAPLTLPSENPQVRATSVFDSSKSGSNSFPLEDSVGRLDDDDGDGPQCVSTDVSISSDDSFVQLSGGTSFTVDIVPFEADCSYDIRWSVVEGGDYGTVNSNGQYTAPATAPPGRSLPFIATVRADVTGGGVTNFGTRTVSVGDLIPNIRTQCVVPDEYDSSSFLSLGVDVRWDGVSTDLHDVEVLRSVGSPNVFDLDNPVCTESGSQSVEGNCRDEGDIELGVDYYYKLRVTYQDGRSDPVREGDRPSFIECSRATISPENVQVFTNAEDTLYVNWTDRDTRPDSWFQLQRMQVTPNIPGVDVEAGAFAPSDSSIRLSWYNATGWTPYTHSIARVLEPPSTLLTDFLTHTSRPLFFEELDDDLVVVLEEDEGAPSFSPNPPNSSMVEPHEFLFTDDNSLEEGTTYYYRISSCSQVPLTDNTSSKYKPDSSNIAFSAAGEADRRMPVAQPSPACSLFSEVISATTLPSAPDLLGVSADSRSRITLRWNDNSSREDGFEIWQSVNGGEFEKQDGEDDGVLRNAGEGEVTSSISGLSSDTSYAYKVRAFRDLDGGEKVFSEFSSPQGAKTHFVVRTSTAGDGSGAVLADSSDGSSGLSCGGGCEFPNETSVTLTADSSDDSEFTGWLDCLPQFTISGNQCKNITQNAGTITANFGLIDVAFQVTLQIKGDGGGSISPLTGAPSITCLKDADAPDATCGPFEPAGASIRLGAVLHDGSAFGSWSGCQGLDNTSDPPVCVVSGEATVTLTLNPVAGLRNSDKFYASMFDAVRSRLGGLSALVRKIASPLFDPIRSRLPVQDGNTAVASGRVASNKAGTLRIYDGSSYADMSSSLTSLFSKGERLVRSLFYPGLLALAEEAPPYDDYFVTVGNGLRDAAYRDDDDGSGLKYDTVYLYRVRSCTDTSCTAWSNEAAGKTLFFRDGDEFAESGSPSPICTRNSFCDYGIFRKVSSPHPDTGEQEASEQQCRNNAACARVGRFSQTFEER